MDNIKPNIKHFILWVFILFIGHYQLNAQCKVKIIVPSTHICLGDTTSMYALGGCGSLLVEHFNDTTLGNQLNSNHPVNITQSCDFGIDGSIYLWFGTQNSGPHRLTTTPLSFSSASYQICFDMRYGEEGVANCDGPSTLSEAVHLQYSTNAGGTWTDIQVWNPNGGHDANLIQWKNYCINLPAGAKTNNTLIRWAQNSSAAINTAVWGLDNINIRKVTSTSYHWSTGTYGAQHPDIHPSAITKYWVSASGSGCTCIDSLRIYPVPRPSATYSYTGKQCKNNDIIFSYIGNANPLSNYQWNFPNASSISGSGQGPITVRWNKTGSYYPTLVVTQDGCASFLYKKEVKINPLISFFINQSSGCEPLTINFKGNAYPKNSTYIWDFGDGGISNDSTPTYTYQNDGVFTLNIIIVAPNGCADTMNFKDFINCYPKPEVDFSWEPSIIPFSNPEANFTNKTQGSNSYFWNFGDNSNSYQQNPSHTYGSLGEYMVLLKATSDKGCTDSLTKLLKVVEDRFRTPNIITPNGDGVNDFFEVENLEYLQSCKLKVFNRWGQEVYSNDEYDNLWNGEDLADGVYFYQVDYTSFFGEGVFRGTLTIMRK
jgi:gliding motility-associated-like protein